MSKYPATALLRCWRIEVQIKDFSQDDPIIDNYLIPIHKESFMDELGPILDGYFEGTTLDAKGDWLDVNSKTDEITKEALITNDFDGFTYSEKEVDEILEWQEENL